MCFLNQNLSTNPGPRICYSNGGYLSYICGNPYPDELISGDINAWSAHPSDKHHPNNKFPDPRTGVWISVGYLDRVLNLVMLSALFCINCLKCNLPMTSDIRHSVCWLGNFLVKDKRPPPLPPLGVKNVKILEYSEKIRGPPGDP